MTVENPATDTDPDRQRSGHDPEQPDLPVAGDDQRTGEAQAAENREEEPPA